LASLLSELCKNFKVIQASDVTSQERGERAAVRSPIT
jgi:hypothetical protein